MFFRDLHSGYGIRFEFRERNEQHLSPQSDGGTMRYADKNLRQSTEVLLHIQNFAAQKGACLTETFAETPASIDRRYFDAGMDLSRERQKHRDRIYWCWCCDNFLKVRERYAASMDEEPWRKVDQAQSRRE